VISKKPSGRVLLEETPDYHLVPKPDHTDGTLELLMRRATGWEQPYFELESFRVTVDGGFERATVRLRPFFDPDGERLRS